jgi:hypothetical protein
MTTGRAAYSRGLRSVSIEMHREYCELGLRLLAKDIRNSLDLFASLEGDEFETARAHAGAK